MGTRNFSNVAVETQLAVSCSDTDVVITVSSVTGWPVAPFTILLDADDVLEEICLVTNVAGSTLTVTRGYGGSSAVTHTAGAVVKHAAVALDFVEANQHVNATSGVHGVTGPLAGTTATQTLTGKTMSGSSNTFTNIPQSAITNLVADLAALDAAIDVAVTGPAGPTGPPGPAGANGADGEGVPGGGGTGQVLAKISPAHFDTDWVDPPSGLPSQSGNTGKFLTTDGSSASWATVSGGATGGGTDKVFYENDQIVTTNYTLTAGKNAMSAGPVTVNGGVTVTVPSGAAWVVV